MNIGKRQIASLVGGTIVAAGFAVGAVAVSRGSVPVQTVSHSTHQASGTIVDVTLTPAASSPAIQSETPAPTETPTVAPTAAPTAVPTPKPTPTIPPTPFWGGPTGSEAKCPAGWHAVWNPNGGGGLANWSCVVG